MPERYRVRAYSRMQRDYGYVGLYRHHYQDLQIKRWWGWQTIDTEEVPNFVRIYLGALGDSGGWRSRFNDIGTWGRDGLLVPHGQGASNGPAAPHQTEPHP